MLRLGPSIGGAFAVTAAGWRWSFYFNLILVGVTFPVFLFILPSRKTSASPACLWARARRIDILGSVLFAGALCSGIMAVSFGGALYSWNSGAIVGLFCCSGVLWIVFGIQQATATFTTKEDRILALHILHSLEMWILIIQTGCSIGMLFITIYYIPLYFQFVRGESAIRSAVDLLPFLFTSVSAMLISGRLITNFGYYKLWFIAGSSLALIMSVCLYTTEIDTSHGQIYGYLILGGVGTGLYAMNAGPVMSAIVAKEHVADASTVFGCVDTLSGAFAVGITNSIFINRATNSIQKLLPSTPRATVQEAIAGVGASLTDKLPPSLRIAVLQAALDAIKDAWVQMIATATLSLILSFFLRNRKLSELSKG
jgi:MFS family permease